MKSDRVLFMKVFKNLEVEKFLHGKTQNNDGGNALIWNRW